jgi:hypothetical protein
MIAAGSNGGHILGICKSADETTGRTICQTDHGDESDVQRRYDTKGTYDLAFR